MWGMSETDTSETHHAECPDCGEETTFSSEGDGKLQGLSCDSCGYLPRKAKRHEIAGGPDV